MGGRIHVGLFGGSVDVAAQPGWSWTTSTTSRWYHRLSSAPHRRCACRVLTRWRDDQGEPICQRCIQPHQEREIGEP